MSITVRVYYLDVPSGVMIKVYNNDSDKWEWFDSLQHAARLNDLWNLLATHVDDKETILDKPVAPDKPHVLRVESCCWRYGGLKAFEAEAAFLVYKSRMKEYMYDCGEWEAQQKRLKAAPLLLLNTLGPEMIPRATSQFTLIEAMKSLLEE